MKTKSWQPVAAPQTAPNGYPVDLPCLMWGNGVGPIGPLPLMLCMFKGLELARGGLPFSIQTEEGDVLVELHKSTVSGVDVLVDLFMRQSNLAASFFTEMMERVIREATTELSGGNAENS